MAEKITITLWDKNKKVKEITAEDNEKNAQIFDGGNKCPSEAFKNRIIKEKGITYVNLEVARGDKEETDAARAAYDFALEVNGGK